MGKVSLLFFSGPCPLAVLILVAVPLASLCCERGSILLFLLWCLRVLILVAVPLSSCCEGEVLLVTIFTLFFLLWCWCIFVSILRPLLYFEGYVCKSSSSSNLVHLHSCSSFFILLMSHWCPNWFNLEAVRSSPNLVHLHFLFFLRVIDVPLMSS